ncbi:MAG: hypothetical protein DCF18_07180 [Cyanobium sp.]|nr:MAG: hypothetical protein DCF18_07180 [Cyanobium sp.]
MLYDNSEVANGLYLSQITIKIHVKSIFNKLRFDYCV